jgi:tryptophanyl-tRNA synthetase
MSDRTPSQLAALERSNDLHDQVLTDPRRFRVLTGDRPTGPLHIGHYLGTLANRVRLQDLGVEVIVLIAANILFCQANLVPVGLDQLPHLETTRLIARRFNERYGDKQQIFPEPDALLTDTPMLAGLDGQKMSKTRGNGIALRASEDETAALIRRAPTDSERHITYDPLTRPAVANLLDLLAATTGQDPHRLADNIGDSGAGRLEQTLTEAVNELLRPLRQRRAALADDHSYIDKVLDNGNDRARQIADRTLTTVHDLLGMTYANRGAPQTSFDHRAGADSNRPTGAISG